jgi:hypothetical protein
LCDALRLALHVAPELESFEDLFDRYSIRDLALAWLGLESIPKGAARGPYLTARRRFERYRAGIGRGPRGGKQTRGTSFEDEEELESFLDSLRERIERGRPEKPEALEIKITGQVQVSKDKRRRTIRQELPAECIEEILEALDADDCDGAAAAFEECFGEAAAMGATPEWGDVDALTAT